MKSIINTIRELFDRKTLAWAGVIASFVFLSSIGFNALMNSASADDFNKQGCFPRADVEEGNIKIENGKARAFVKNNTAGDCTYDLTLSAFKVFVPQSHPDFHTTQELFDTQTVSLAPGDFTWLEVSIPQCAFQADLYFASGPQIPDGEVKDRLLKFHLDTSAGFCEPENQCPANFEDPVLISPTELKGLQNGDNINYTIAFSGDGDISVADVKGLPWWLKWDGGTKVTGKIPADTGSNTQVSFTVFLEAESDGLICGDSSAQVTIFWDKPPQQCPVPAPTITGAPTATATKGQFFKYTFSSTGGYPLKATGLPAGLQLLGADGLTQPRIQGTPTQTGVFNVAITAENECGKAVLDIEITVGTDQCPDGLPSISGNSTANGTVGAPFSYTAVVTGNTENVQLTAGVLPNGLTFNQNTRTISGTPTQTGVFDVVLTASNQCGSDNLNLRITINQNQCPIGFEKPVIIGDSAINAKPGDSINYQFSVSGDGQINTTILSLPSWLSFNANTKTISGVVPANFTGNEDFTISSVGVDVASGNICGENSKEVTINVVSNQCPDDFVEPNITGDTERTINVGNQVNYVFGVTGSGTKTVTVEGLPSWLTYNPSNKTITGTMRDEIVNFTIDVVAKDSVGRTCGVDSLEVTLRPNTGNRECPDVEAPVVTSRTNFDVKARQKFEYLITYTGEGDIDVSVEDLPDWLDFDPDTNIVSGTVPENKDYSFKIRLDQTVDGEQCEETETIVRLDFDGGPGGRCVNCGDDDDEPRVLVSSNRFDQPGGEILGVALTQVPVTGVGSALQSIIFTIGLLIISAGLAYLIMSRRMRQKLASIFSSGEGQYAVEDASPYSHQDFGSSEADERGVYASSASAAFAPTAPFMGGVGSVADLGSEKRQKVEERFAELTGTRAVVQDSGDTNDFSGKIAQELSALARKEARREEASSVVGASDVDSDTSLLEAKIEEAARNYKALLSDDGVQTLVKASGANESNAMSILSELVKVADEWYAREDEWLLLNQKRIKEVLFATYVMMVPTFLTWIAEGKDEKIFGFIKMLQSQGHSVKEFIKHVVYELDALYRYRTEGSSTDVSKETLKVAGRWNLSTIEKTVEALIGAVDATYSNDFTPVKLALLKTMSLAKEESRA